MYSSTSELPAYAAANLLQTPLQALEHELRRDLDSTPAARIAADHLDGGGRRIRARLALELNASLALPAEAGMAAACSAELLHNASLVHDDIQDAAEWRRGRPSVVALHGGAVALCVGDLLISAAWAALSRLPAPSLAPAMRCMHAAIARTCHGQLEDLQATARDESAYRHIVAAKSGALLALPVQLIALVADPQAPHARLAAIERVTAALSESYQIQDDLTDAAEDRRQSRLNLVCLLEDAGRTAHAARGHAHALAVDALSRAEREARSLPAGLGNSLVTLAQSMRTSVADASGYAADAS